MPTLAVGMFFFVPHPSIVSFHLRQSAKSADDIPDHAADQDLGVFAFDVEILGKH
jgi:hypothetical protein